MPSLAALAMLSSTDNALKESLANLVRQVSIHAQCFLVDFFETVALVRAIARVLIDPGVRQYLGSQARRRVCEYYDLKRHCLLRQLMLIESIDIRAAPSNAHLQ